MFYIIGFTYPHCYQELRLFYSMPIALGVTESTRRTLSNLLLRKAENLGFQLGMAQRWR